MIKKIKYTLLASIVAVALMGCEDKFLTQSNPNAITDMTFWKSESDFEKAVNALYGSLQLPSVSGTEFLTNEPLRSDLAGTESWYTAQLVFDKLRWDDANSYVASRWSELYVGVYRANQILYHLPDAEGIIEADELKLIEGHAKFIRGYCYFMLANSYNGAVIVNELPTNAEKMHKPFSPRAEVISTMVIPDLTDAKSILPKKWDASGLGKATWGAATAMLGKTYLYDKKWSEAGAQFAEIINSELYSLVPKFMDNFTTDNEFNSESVFEVSFSDSFKPGTSPSQHDEIDGSEATGIAQAYASITGGGGFNTVLPSYCIQEMFVAADQMDPSNKWTSSHERSIRTYSTIVVEYGDGDYYKAPLTEYTDADGNIVASKANFSYGQGSKIKKWTQWDRVEAENSSNGCRTGINYRAIRYSDILLMYAEALLEQGKTSDAIPYVDKVRSRAGVITLSKYMEDNGGKIPQLHISSFANNRTDVVAMTSQYNFVEASAENLLTHIRRVERVLEFAYEGHRWYDLVRWGIAKEVFDQGWEEEQKLKLYFNTNADGNFPSDVVTVKEYPLFLNQRIRPDFELASNNYKPDVHDYFPIPSIETENNNAL